MDGLQILQFSILEVSGNFSMNIVQNRTILVFKEVPRLVYSNLKSKIGNPGDYDQVKHDPSYFEKAFDLKIYADKPLENQEMNTPHNEPSEVCQPQEVVS